MSESPILLCPGQGAQAVGMGHGWFMKHPEAAQVFGAADAIIGDRFGRKLSDLCFHGPSDELNRTDIAQPAIYTVSVACFHAQFGGAKPSSFAATAGLSLGEYTALHLAGAFSFEAGLNLVVLRGKAMQEAAEATQSGMLALIGPDEPTARDLCQAVLDQRGEGAVLVPANFNAPGQIVLSGDSASCDLAEAVAAERGVRFARLAVAGAFHSPLMAPAAERLAAALAETTIAAPACPVMANVTAEPHDPDPDSIRALLVRQLTEPVRWAESCVWMNQQLSGVYHELAPGKVLAGLMRRIDRQTKVVSHDEPQQDSVADTS